MILGFIRSQGGKQMDVIMDGIQWFIGLGSTVFTSNYFIIGLFFGLKPSKAFISGVTVGIGNID